VSPPVAVNWQSAATSAGLGQTVAQYVAKSSQLRSGSGLGTGVGSELPVVTGGALVQGPLGTRCSSSAQLRVVPPTQAAVPQASTRCSPPLIAVQTQFEWAELQASTEHAESTRA
jgi:hypothetical protein